MNENFKITEIDGFAIWFDYTIGSLKYSGCYDGANLNLDKKASWKVQARIEQLCDDYFYGNHLNESFDVKDEDEYDTLSMKVKKYKEEL